jgi:hypothetical protein
MAREERVGATEDREVARGRPPGPKNDGRANPLKDRPPEVIRTVPREGGDTWRQGQAARPHFPMSRLQSSRGSQAPHLLLLTTGAT